MEGTLAGRGQKKGLPTSGRQPSKAREHHPRTLRGVPISWLDDLEAAPLELAALELALDPGLLLDDAAVEEVDRPLGIAGEAGVVSDHADGGAVPVEVRQ